jgi:hypothetical protein
VKGILSKRLETVLRDPKGRSQLRELLAQGRDGKVEAAGRTYTVRVDARSLLKTASRNAKG